MLVLATPFPGKANENGDEVPVFVSVQNHGIYISALLQDETLYLPVKDLFDFLKINNNLSSAMDSVGGYIIDAKAKFLIDYVQQEIQYHETSFPLTNNELIRTPSNLYLRSDVFGKVFGLDCNFQFRNLAVTIHTKLDLPLLQELRQQALRNNIRKITGEIKPDTSINRKYAFLRLGTVDWNIVHTKVQTEALASRINVQLGGLFARGEALVLLNYDTKGHVAKQQHQYKWRYVDNNQKIFRQVLLGNLAVQATASLFTPVIGMQVTNAPTTRRKSFGTYIISDKTQPGWMVELYVNNVLVSYVRADASGFYSFPVPLVYGNSRITLKFFGPSGEEHSNEKIIQIPFNFLPVHTFEYNITAGLVRDSLHSRFSRANFQYGLTHHVTVGGGIEYLSSVRSGSSMPFFYTTIRIAKTALFSTEYTNGVRWKSLLSWQLPLKAQLELNYLRYTKGQRAVLSNNLEERIAAISIPIRNQKFFFLSKIAVRQVILPAIAYDSLVKVKYSEVTKSKYTGVEWTMSSSYARFNTNITTSGFLYDNAKFNLYSNFALAYHFPHGILVRPQFQFNYNERKLIAARFETEKHLSNQGLINFSLVRDFSLQVTTVTCGLRYNFSFLRTAFAVVRSNKITSLVQSAGGSLLYDAPSRYATHSRHSYSRRGSLLVVPFLDMNNNGKRDKEEPGVRGLQFRISSGRVLSNKGEELIRIADLEPYTAHLLELDEKSLGNIAWRIKNKRISVVVEPNVFKHIEVPIAVVGEVSGMVYLDNDVADRRISRVLVNFYDSSGKLAAQTMTENDGYFSYLGLAPGGYMARIDSAQLDKLHISSAPATISYQIASNEEGVISDGLKFVLHSLNKNGVHQNIIEHHQVEVVKQSFANQDEHLLPVSKQPADTGLLRSFVKLQHGSADSVKRQQNANNLPKTRDQVKQNRGAERPAATPLLSKQSKAFILPQKTHLNNRQSPMAQKEKMTVQKQLQLQTLQLYKKNDQLYKRIQELKIEQQLLIREQKKLLREIRSLKMRRG
ncbi:MAG TPA: hypothetical protein VM935_11160 [Chitinophagaceae bacterium]|nr:hypothetical protein [Chitinophagaceae bacterium]